MNDIIVDADYDLQVANGDFIVSGSLNQQTGCLLAANQGDYRQHPKAGVGIQGYILDEHTDELNREIRLQFRKDNMEVTSLKFNNGSILINVKNK